MSLFFTWIYSYLLYFLYVINDKIFRSYFLDQFLWDLIKSELFYIGGACQQSGNCCRGIMLFDKNTALNTVERFSNFVSKKTVYDRFKPVFSSHGTIHSYNCDYLMSDNTCSDYKNRPKACRQYPYSHFIKYDSLRQHCGYKVMLRQNMPCFSYPSLKRRIELVCSKNEIIIFSQ